VGIGTKLLSHVLMQGVVGRQSKQPHHIEMQEGGVGWIEMPPSCILM